MIPNESLRTSDEAEKETEATWLTYLGDAIKVPIMAASDAVTYGIASAGQAVQRALGVPEGLLQTRMGRGTSIFAMSHVRSVTLTRGTKDAPGVSLVVLFYKPDDAVDEDEEAVPDGP